MLTINEALVIQQLAIFADINDINKSEISRKIKTTPKTVRTIINKLKHCEINLKKGF